MNIVKYDLLQYYYERYLLNNRSYLNNFFFCVRSMKQNLVVFLADMYNVLEIHPAKCVRYPGEERAMQFLDGT